MGHFSTLILILLLIAFLLRVDFVFYIIYVCVGVYAWSRWYTPRALHRLAAGRSYSDHAFWGETVPVTLRLVNNSRLLIPWVQISESLAIELKLGEPVNQVLSLRGRETTELTYHVKGRRRGYYRLGPMRLTTSDLFGLLPEQQGTVPADFLTVYPRIIPLSRLGLPSRLPFGTIASRQRLFEDPARPMGVRDFRSGDSLRQINWKVSAHTRNLVVKTFQPAISLQTALLLNLNAGEYTRQGRQIYAEWAIEVAASLAAHLEEQRQAVGLMTNGVDPLHELGDESNAEFDEASGRLLRTKKGSVHALAAPLPPAIFPRSGRAHLMKILERLARVEAENTIAFNQWAPTACLHLSWGVTILAITPTGDESTCETLHRLLRAGFNPILIAVEPDYNFSQVRERARRLGFSAFNVTRLRDMDRWR